MREERQEKGEEYRWLAASSREGGSPPLVATTVQVALDLWTHIQQQGCPPQNSQKGAGYESSATWGCSWKLYPLNWVIETG